ncbi:MAG: glycosyltransferase, partial [Minisyncoccia bacterium]
GYGGAERVVLELHRMFPSAPIYTSQYDPKSLDWFKDADVRTTWLQKLPKGLRKFLPVLRALAFSRLNLIDYDLVISSSGAEAKFVKVKKPTIHISYCHSPTHYYWVRYDEYMKNPGFGAFNWLGRMGLKLLVGPMKRWDYKAARRPDYFIANSSFTKDNIKKYYGREATVIYPPVEIERFKSDEKVTRQGFVTAGRQTPYMRKDIAVAACSQLNLPLTVIGDGPEHAKLVKMAGSTVKFLTNVSDQELPNHFRGAKAFILPGKEDFGIVAVEAMAAGTPVIAYANGGVLDTVISGETGEFFKQQSAESLAEVLKNFKPEQYYSGKITAQAERFSQEKFHKNIKEFISNL